MGWFVPAAGLSKKAKAVLQGMADSGSSEGAGVAEILNTIAENGDGSENGKFLVGCAEEIRGWADHFIKAMTPKPKQSPEPRLNLPKRLRGKGKAA